jgi:hypothetical protein
MARLKFWILQILIALDQLCTALIGGWADETLSSYAWRMEQEHKPWGRARAWIDRIFFWMPQHCYSAYLAERQRAQLPPEFRAVVIAAQQAANTIT